MAKKTKKSRKKNLNHVRRQYKVAKAKRRTAKLLKKKVRNWQKMRLRKTRRGRVKS